jgi:putative transcriptional regulator
VNFEAIKRPSVDDRPVDSLLAGYVARTLAPPLEALVESHLEMKPDNRGYVAALTAASGVFLEQIDPIPLTGRDRRLVNIFAMRDHACPCIAPSPAEAAAVPGSGLPRALRRYAGRDELSGLAWHTVRSGVDQVVVAEGAFGEARFLRCRAGRPMRMHGHSGLEAILVLEGVYADQDGRYGVGDIVVADECSIHRPVIDTDADLVLFMVSPDKIACSGPLARMLDQIFGR